MTTATRRVFRFVTWTLRLDQDDDAPPLTYAFRCLTLRDDDTECGARSQPSTDPAAARKWAFGHLREHPGHTSYAEVIERPWVMWPGEPV
ncbi:hypothetical protein JJV70_04735 [Streptomyces sp. JJ66]|uniref:DUF7848 domain-containing protein n=1 Tax=Streptomyces sp. JJ66 TaxID=2803843 RepID=UPI001C586C45|nr:hypothetical protein [Streptomyces sp. JJ66]MBW1601423.1 hypothetical protein [Streptomyces sp. JJ66]